MDKQNFIFIKSILQYFLYYIGYYLLKASYVNCYSKEFTGIFTGEHDEKKQAAAPYQSQQPVSNVG